MVNTMKTKIGVLGGTFDPIHKGHLALAKAAFTECSLDKVIFIPTGISYMKTGVSLASDRFEMCRLALYSHKEFELDDVEIKREGNTYTYETLRYLKKKYRDSEIYFIIGLDTLYTIESWKNVSEVFKNSILLCADRPSDKNDKNISVQINYLQEKYAARIIMLDMAPYSVSSTQIREAFRNKDYTNMVLTHIPENVKEYIIKHGLYTRFEEIKRELQFILKPKRFQHTLGVVETAVMLAKCYGADPEIASISALLHDCAKHMPIEDMISLCRQYGVSVSNIESQSDALLHGKAGAILSKKNYGFINNDIYDAIFYHTTGKPNMSLLTQIIFVADYIEPGRNHSEKLDYLRELAKTDLNRVTALILKDTLHYLNEHKNDKIDIMTEIAFEFYKKYL